jgi:predicted small lipoprotein YifL
MLLRPKLLSKFLLSALVVLIAASCGLKGPLYHPDETKNETVAPAEDAAGVTRKKQGESSTQPPAIDPDRPAVPPGDR